MLADQLFKKISDKWRRKAVEEEERRGRPSLLRFWAPSVVFSISVFLSLSFFYFPFLLCFIKGPWGQVPGNGERERVRERRGVGVVVEEEGGKWGNIGPRQSFF